MNPPWGGNERDRDHPLPGCRWIGAPPAASNGVPLATLSHMWHFATFIAEPTPIRRPPRWDNLRSDEAERIIREWAQDTSRVVITRHAFERSEERSEIEPVDTPTIYRILQTGQISASPPRINSATGRPPWRHACRAGDMRAPSP